MQRRIVSGLFRNGHNCAQGRVAPRRRNYWRARELPELLHGIIALGKSVILTASGHRVASGTWQDITIDPYILSGLNGIYRDYLYGIYRAGKLTSIIFASIFERFWLKLKSLVQKFSETIQVRTPKNYMRTTESIFLGYARAFFHQSNS